MFENKILLLTLVILLYRSRASCSSEPPDATCRRYCTHRKVCSKKEEFLEVYDVPYGEEIIHYVCEWLALGCITHPFRVPYVLKLKMLLFALFVFLSQRKSYKATIELPEVLQLPLPGDQILAFLCEGHDIIAVCTDGTSC